MHRRTFLQCAGLGASALALAPASVAARIAGRRTSEAPRAGFTPAPEIEERVRQARPLRGGVIPADLRARLGTTHYDGHYHLTTKPFLVEGAEEIYRLGLRVAKFWLREDGLPGYGYNSTWKPGIDDRLVDVLKTPYYREALAIPFSTVIFEVFPLAGSKASFFSGRSDFAEEEAQLHETAAHLLKTYADRDVTFILQHWEGDWMLRRSEGGNWASVPAAEAQRRCDAFIGFLTARQRGVDRARREAPAGTRCRIYHASEVNRVWDGINGQVTMTTHVIPHVTLDLVSWSSYDGMGSAVAAWQGLEFIRQKMRPSPFFGHNGVYIGEIGKPENEATEAEIIEWWDRAMGVFFALEIPWIVHWELYCNEPRVRPKSDRSPRTAEQMRGFWWVKPDGTLGVAARYLTDLLNHAGGRLRDAERR